MSMGTAKRTVILMIKRVISMMRDCLFVNFIPFQILIFEPQLRT